MKKRIIILTALVFCVTGCNAEYNLNISEDNFEENLIITSENNNENTIILQYEKPIETLLDAPTISEVNESTKKYEKIEGVEYYNIQKNTISNNYTLTINNKFSNTEYIKSNIANNTSSTFEVYENDNIYKIRAGKLFKCFDIYNNLNNLTIKIKLSDTYELLDQNADIVNGKTLIWNINKSNYQNKPIILSYQNKNKKDNNNPSNTENNNEEKDNKKDKKNKLSDYALYIFCSVLILLILIGYNMFNRIKNKSDRVDD